MNNHTKTTPQQSVILKFIDDFLMLQNDDVAAENLRFQYKNGYCYYFAKMLQTAFQRGTICLCAPFGHFIWLDDDNTPYDIEGIYCGEAYYYIPEQYLGEHLNNFLHNGSDVGTTHDDIVEIVKNYCTAEAKKYFSELETFL